MRIKIIPKSDSAYTEILPLMSVINSNVQENTLANSQNRQIVETKSAN